MEVLCGEANYIAALRMSLTQQGVNMTKDVTLREAINRPPTSIDSPGVDSLIDCTTILREHFNPGMLTYPTNVKNALTGQQ